ncbi:hypothetical protein Aple_095540 [Acrocarpospora pleiomorpha]|uniref:Uncharacterized protein n=1 Tax=Acrocarpospora pleiomorpha TaxID=90975 RepID=A0A5M3XZX2_9ACTN|nr:hypothetical protein [Acrocarpospora pleiomorpha]GES26655.1 hypothetical protein Aple_095540 [Acrocarpospora pleiomorpha]
MKDQVHTLHRRDAPRPGVAAALPTSTGTAHAQDVDEADYVIIGSGPGGAAPPTTR